MKLSVIECVLSPEMHASDLGTNHVFEGFLFKVRTSKANQWWFSSLSLCLSLSKAINEQWFLKPTWVPVENMDSLASLQAFEIKLSRGGAQEH